MPTILRPDSPAGPGVTRRTLAAMSLGGLSLAALPALAQSPQQQIRTPETGLNTAVFNVAVQGGATMPTYVAYPAARGRYPVIVLVSESFGVNDYLRDVARRLARAGYMAVAPDFFFRAGDPSAAANQEAFTRIVTSATNEQVMSDIAAVLYWARSMPAAEQRFGIVGFSWGGAVVWMAMQRFPDFRAGVSWYGRLRRPPADSPLGVEVRPWPLEVASTIRAPVLGLYAGNDPGIPIPDVEEMKAALVAARRRGSDLVVYPGTEHQFHADYRPSYNAAAAEDGWAKMLDHLSRNGLRGRPPRN